MTPVEIRAGSTAATIAPDAGFSLYSLVVDGFDYIHSEQGFPRTRTTPHSGTPVLFPWPNRIAGGHFTWQGTEYALPVNEPATGSSLHGFAHTARWRLLETGPAHATGEFVLHRDAPGHAWPADAGLRVTYRVEPTALMATCEVFSDDGRDLPFGLGFHPYLRVPGPFDQWLLQVDAGRYWPLAGMVPEGPPRDVPAELDFRRPRRLGDQHLDHVLTDLPPATGMTRRAALLSMASSVTVSSDPGFRDYVVFTTPTRDAVAIEPYTCTTDAVNLQARGIDAGWQVLPAGQTRTFSWRIDIA